MFGNIITHVYKSDMSRLFLIYLDILREELSPFHDKFSNEIIFLEELLQSVIEKDYDITESIEDLQSSLILHVNPGKFVNMMQIVKPNLYKFESVYLSLRKQRNKIMKVADGLM